MKIKIAKFMELNISVATISLNTQVCSSCNDDYQQKFDENLKEQFSNHNNNKFMLLLRKGIYPYKYENDWEKLNEKSLPQKNF